jgi:nitrogen PTS system EIIA component
VVSHGESMSILRMSQVIVAKAFTRLAENCDKRTVVATLVDALVRAKKIAPEHVDTVIEGAMARELIGSTGIGHGIAIPHCRTGIVKQIMCAFGSSDQGIDFDSLDDEPVHSVFLLLTPPDQKEQHLQLMKSFASQIRQEHFCEFLHQVKSAESLIDLLTEFESR